MKVLIQKHLKFADIFVYDNGIFHIHVLGKIPLTLEQAKTITENRKTLMSNKKALVLTTSNDKFVVPTQEVIEYLECANRLDTVKATAFVVSSFSQRLSVKSSNLLSRMPTLIACFSTKEEAVEWLLSKKD
jgi:hypothetical protein